MMQMSQSMRPDVISLADEERVNDVVLCTVRVDGREISRLELRGSRPEAVACQGRIRHRRELPAAHRRLPSFVAGGAEKENERVGRLVVGMVGSAWALTLVSAGMRNEVL